MLAKGVKPGEAPLVFRAAGRNYPRMATGWAREGAEQDQIDATIKDGIKRAQSRLPSGESLESCASCGARIPEARRAAIPGVRLCVACQEAHDREQGAVSGYNRRGSKDSELR